MRIFKAKPSLKYRDDKLRLFFIGVGSAFSRKHNQTNLLIIKGEDHVLVDFGAKGPQALKDVAGMKVSDIRVTLATHSHADHVGGYEEMGIQGRYVGVKQLGLPKPKMIVTEEYQRILWDCSLRGGMEWNEALDESGHPADTTILKSGHIILDSVGRKLNFSDYFEPVRPHWMQMQPREKYEIDVGSLHFEMFRTKHIPEQSPSWESSFWSCGLMIDGRIFFSGDTRFDPALINEYKDHAEWIFHDCQLHPGAVHAYYGELHDLDKDVRERMILMHYGDSWRKFKPQRDGFHSFARQGVQYIF